MLAGQPRSRRQSKAASVAALSPLISGTKNQRLCKWIARWPGWLPPDKKEGAMCEKWDEIDKTIERYRRIQRTILDQALINGAQN